MLGGGGCVHVVVAEPTQSAGATPLASPAIVKMWPLFSGGLTRTAKVGSSPMKRSPLCGLTPRPRMKVYVDTGCPGFSSESYGGATVEDTTSWKPVLGS